MEDVFQDVFFFWLGGGQISRITQTSLTADPQLTPKNKGHGLRCQCSTEALADGSLKKVWGDSRVLVVEKSRSFFFWRKLISWFGGLLVGGDVLRGCLPFFFPGAVFNLFFLGDLDVLGSSVFLRSVSLSFKARPVSWFMRNKMSPRPAKATVTTVTLGGFSTGRRDMCCLCRTFEEMQADSPIDLISRELLLSSLHPGVSCFEGAQKRGKCGMPASFFFF